MAKEKVNRSEAIRQLLKTNRKMSPTQIVETLAARGLKVNRGLVYFVQGQIKGKRISRRKNRRLADRVASRAGTGSGDALSAILKIKGLAAEVGGLPKLKALVEAMSD